MTRRGLGVMGRSPTSDVRRLAPPKSGRMVKDVRTTWSAKDVRHVVVRSLRVGE